MEKNDVAESGLVGTRIRERRVASGIKQADLAARANISASYLNLIEHNRRRIGGALVLRIAGALGVEPAVLIRGPAAALVTGLQEVAANTAEHEAEVEAIEELADRFPGWSDLLIRSHKEIARLEGAVDALTDRLSHDPDLAGRLHEVLSVVTAIRSTASILVETPELEPDWSRRFHRNIDQDSRRLAEGAEALAAYLDAKPGEALGAVNPMEELGAFLDVHGHHFPSLEQKDGGAVAKILDEAETLRSDAARSIALDWLKTYRDDAAALPLGRMAEAIEAHGLDPLAITRRVGETPTRVMRRLAGMPERIAGELGHVLCDGGGVLLGRRLVDGFAVPGGAGACPLWPVFQALGQPDLPLRVPIRQMGRDSRAMIAFAISEATPRLSEGGYNRPLTRRAQMLLIPDSAGNETLEPVEHVGVTCRVCPRAECPARREPSVLRDTF